MNHAKHASVQSRIDTLRQWRGRNDPDAQMMAEMLEEIERLEALEKTPPGAA